MDNTFYSNSFGKQTGDLSQNVMRKWWPSWPSCLLAQLGYLQHCPGCRRPWLPCTVSPSAPRQSTCPGPYAACPPERLLELLQQILHTLCLFGQPTAEHSSGETAHATKRLNQLSTASLSKSCHSFICVCRSRYCGSFVQNVASSVSLTGLFVK